MNEHESPKPERHVLPKVCFDSANEPSAGLDMWRELCRPAFDIEMLDEDRPFASAFDFVDVGGLIFNRTSYSATRFTRSKRHIRSDGGDGLLLHLILKGKEAGEAAGGMACDTGPGRIVLHDWAQPFVKETTAVEQLSVFVPRHLLPSVNGLPLHSPTLSWSTDQIAGRILEVAVREIWRQLPQTTFDQAPKVAAGFLGLLNGLMESETIAADSHQFNDATLSAMKAYLVERLGNPRLGPDDLIAAFHCSRSKMYRLFEAYGGVQAFIQEQRLQACLRELTRCQESRRPVARLIAERHGFTDTGHFHRRFKKRFGCTPGEAWQEAMENAGGRASDNEAESRIGTVHRFYGY